MSADRFFCKNPGCPGRPYPHLDERPSRGEMLATSAPALVEVPAVAYEAAPVPAPTGGTAADDRCPVCGPGTCWCGAPEGPSFTRAALHADADEALLGEETTEIPTVAYEAVLELLGHLIGAGEYPGELVGGRCQLCYRREATTPHGVACPVGRARTLRAALDYGDPAQAAAVGQLRAAKGGT